MAYRFNGSSDKVEFAISPFSGVTVGAFTVAILLKRNTAGTGSAQDMVVFTTNAPAQRLRLFAQVSDVVRWAGAGNINMSQTFTSTSVWYLLVLTRAAGTVTPRFHLWDGTSWSHADGNTTSTDSTIAGTDKLTVGCFNVASPSEFLAADVVCAGAKFSNSADATVETLNATAFSSWRGFGFNWLIGFDTSLVSGGVLQDQGSVGTGDQTAISGTSVVSDPPGWAWSSAVTPVANFTGTPTSGSSPLSVAFTDTSSNTPTSWAWNFGDGATSTSQNPTHTYAAASNYDVTLVATNSAGSDTKFRNNYVHVSAGVTTRATATRALRYGISGKVSNTRSVRWQILTPPARISANRRVYYAITGHPVSSRQILYDIATGVEPAGRFALAFDQGALQWDEAVWTQIDSYPNLVTSYQIDRGRQYELDRTDTGRATVVIADQDGILDPTNPTGPFYGRIQPLVQARIGRRNPVTGAWNTRYRGYIEDLTYSFDPSQQVNRLTLTLVDQFEILSAIEMQPGRFGGGTDADGQIVFNVAGVQSRIKGVLADAGLETHAYVVFSGNVDVSKVTYSAGESPMTVIQECADGEFSGVSNVYCDRKGRLVFHGRFAKFSPDSVAAGASSGAWDFQRWKVGDGKAVHASPADTAQLRSFGFERGLAKVINQATASPTGIADADVAGQLVEDLPSITRYGIRSWSATNLVTHRSAVDGADANTETKRQATYYATNYNTPRDRVMDVSIRSMQPGDPRAAAVWKLLGEIDVSDAVAVTVDSPGGGGFVASSYFVEGIHETCQPATGAYDDVTLTLDLSPEAYYTTNPWPGKVTSTRQLRYKVGP